ncbi:MAG TPA: glycosyltransferase family 39 protein [Baekduia sp.]|uniref:glycosyltransferase family 39 protein n=1 Tax=Baekduia sp. TaxID=2600305 RepID=UPI002D784F02|nr:glycosyltransferase family 39 protein [Baekduia sp.]HET6506139.1 glycosyltransferase family 39 protein [Baekduia sp.]
MESATHPHDRPWNSTRRRDRLPERLRALPLPRPELVALLGLAALLYLWALSKNGWANDYYSAAVRSMAGSWHDFLYGSFDAKGLMTVDKPPLALWVEALSAKVFGFDPLAILVPQALMGVASVGLLYDLTRRRWGRTAGTVAGLALALTPVVVAISRHNNPDALLVLCSVSALWCFVRALERGATRWLVLAGACVGLGFEAKMGAALMVVPGMALAWLWVAPRGRRLAIRQLAVAGAALVAVALAWPVLVWLTPASARPWISGTGDNSIWSLIWEYNGLGRLEGQTGGPGNLGAGGTFGGPTGAFRLLNEALGGQAGWLLGAALAGGVGIAALSRLRRDDPRTGWIIAVGGAFGVTAVAFSFAGGIFHPYYTSLLAPFAAALVGATVGQVLAGERGDATSPAADPRPGAAASGDRGGADATLGGDRGQATLAVSGEHGSETVAASGGHGSETVAVSGDHGGPIATRIVGAVAIGLGAIVELVVVDHSASDLDWLVAPLVAVSVAAVGALLFADALAGRLGGRATAWRVRMAALACGLGILLVGPAIWSVDTLGHPTSGTFPAGGPESASMGGPGGIGGPGGPGGIGAGHGGTTSGPGGATSGPGGTTSGPGGATSLPGGTTSGPGGGMSGPTGSGNGGPPSTSGGFEGGPPSFGGAEDGGMSGLPSPAGSEGGELPRFGGEGTEAGELPGIEGSESGSSGLPGGERGAGTAGSGGGTVGELFGESGSTAGGLPSLGAGGSGSSSTGGGPGGMFGGEDLSSILAYTEAHGGGTIAIDSQSGAAASIIESGAEVAGIGGFSGKESSVSAAWLEERIANGDIAWIYTSGLGGAMGGTGTGVGTGGAGAKAGTGAGGPSGGEGAPGGGFGGDTRTGSESAIDTVVESCTAIPTSAYGSSSESESSASVGAPFGGAGGGTLYKCGGS